MTSIVVPAAVAGVLLVAALSVQTVRLSSAHTELAQAKTEYLQQVANAQAVAKAVSDQFRELEGVHRDEIASVNAQGQAQLSTARAAADRSSAVAERLQHELDNIVSAAREAAADCAASGGCAADAGPIVLLADLRRRADIRAGELAAEADGARVRGLTCEAAYDSARATLERARAAVE